MNKIAAMSSLNRDESESADSRIDQDQEKTGLDYLRDLRQTLYALEMMRSILEKDFPVLLNGYKLAYTQKLINENLAPYYLQELGKIPEFLREMVEEMRTSLQKFLEKFEGSDEKM